jgi:type VI secretion system protein ImpC
MTESADWTPDFGGISVPPPPWAARRPVRMAILGDFSAGALRGRLETGAALARRKPIRVEFDTLEDALGRLDLRLTLPIGAQGAAVEVPITELESFHPDELYRNLELFSALAGLRKRLNTPSSFAAAAAEVQAWGGERLARASALSRQARPRGAMPSAGARMSDFARLTGRPSAAESADQGVQALLRRIVGPFVVAAENPRKDELVSAVDLALADAMRAVLHQGDFQNAESLWRGVDFLLRRLETGPRLQVWLVDLSAEELAADLSSCGDLADTGLYKMLVEGPAQDAEGGYSYLCGCYQFEASPVHAELLGRMARIAAHAGAPFLTGIATDAFTDRKEPPHRLVARAFQDLKALPDASCLALLGPRFLLRHPYGRRSDPISSFAFEEFSPEAGLRGMLWGHPAMLALAVLGVPGGQLAIDDLPFHHFTDKDGDSVALPCTDRLIGTQAAQMLRQWGLTGVMAHKGEALVRLAGLEALNGDGLALAPGTLRKAPADSRFAVSSNIAATRSGAQVAMTSAIATRGATAAAASPVTAAAAAASPAPAAVETAAPASESVSEAPAPGDAASEVDAELAALLASLGGDDAPAAQAEPAAPAAAVEEEMDPELAELLKSLG